MQDRDFTQAHTAPAPASGTSAAPLARHLARGAIGFGLIGSGLALTPVAGPAALLLGVPGFVALRGCPMCWMAGLVEAVSAGRLERTCTDAGCELRSPTASATEGTLSGVGH
jgi:hypothetical protein